MAFINIAAYKFITLSAAELPELRASLKKEADALNIKGTILLSQEGINLFLAGSRAAIDAYQAFLATYSAFNDLVYKESPSSHQPFTRMLVRLKKEIIAMGCDEIKPEEHTAPHLSPQMLKQWYEDGKDMVVLDTRNDYEVALGTFKDAVDLNIETFRDFPNVVDMLPDEVKEKPVVTFCTGGIRCEKAAELMLRKGFKNVYQLDGGILNYFEQCGGDFYDGECFVFDKRVAVDANLQETATRQCYACRNPLPLAEQAADAICPHCHRDTGGKRAAANSQSQAHSNV